MNVTVSKSNSGWQHFHHDADIGIRGIGGSMEEAFEQAGLALTSIITDINSVRANTTITIHCEANERELLLADWLNSIIYEMVTRHMLFARYEVHIRGKQLDGTLSGEALDQKRHHPAVEPKGATYTALDIMQNNNGKWIAQCVIDV